MALKRFVALALLAFVFVSWQQPEVAGAQRVRAKTAKQAKSKKVLTAREKVKRTSTRAATAKKSRVKKTAKGFARVRTSLKLRDSVRLKNASAKAALKEGQLATAATLAGRSGTRNAKGQFTKGGTKLTIRERFSNWRATRKVKRAAFAQAKSRSKKGNWEGTADAMQALNTLQASGKLGLFARWKKAREPIKYFVISSAPLENI